MLFDEDDASLLKKWIVKRLEDISDADSDVLADYVLALLRHDQGEDEVKQLCVEQLDDFLREHTSQFADDVFTALTTKAFRSVNSTLTGGGLSVHIPTRQESPPSAPPTAMSISPRSVTHHDQSAGLRAPKRSYFDRDEPDEDDRHKPFAGRDRGSKMPRRGAPYGPGRWNSRGGLDAGVGRGGFQQPQPSVPALGQPTPFGMPPAGSFPPWMPPPNPNDPMSAFLAAQAAAAWAYPSGGQGAKLGEGKKIVKKAGERCKDYDEKGFCMKGDMCPYEHGVDHIVVPGQEAKSEEYDPNDSMLFSASNPDKRGGRRGSQRARGSRGSLRGARGGRAEFSTTGPNYDRTNTKLVVENIPEDKLSESAIKEFFGTFGTVDNVEIHQHKNLAILKFTHWDMAKAAYDSPAPIFDNRFVKVFWCKPAQPDGADASPTAANGYDTRRFSAPMNEQRKEEEEVKIDIEEVKRKQEELQKAHEEKMVKKKANEEAAKKLQKRKEELMKLQQEEKKKLMEKLAKKHAASVASASPTPGPGTPSTNGTISNPSPEKSKADATTAALKAQLEALQAEAQALGIDQNATEDTFDLGGFRGRGRGRGGRFATTGRGGYPPRGRGFSTYRGRGATYAPRGRGGAPTMKLDNRTKRVAVTASDMKGDKEEEFRHYLINNGIELEAIEPHPEKEDTQIFTFQDRRNAEKFVFSGNEIPNVGTVSMAWHNVPATFKPPPPPPATNDDSDMQMADINTSYHGRVDDDSYDLAEDDEGRWLPE